MSPGRPPGSIFFIRTDENGPIMPPASRFRSDLGLNPSGLSMPSSVPQGAAGDSGWSKFQALACVSVKISQKLGGRVCGDGWKIVAPHAKNMSNPDQFHVNTLCHHLLALFSFWIVRFLPLHPQPLQPRRQDISSKPKGKTVYHTHKQSVQANRNIVSFKNTAIRFLFFLIPFGGNESRE
jgi:hypothetical protein